MNSLQYALLLWVVFTVEASKIVFDGTPNSITPSLTTNLKLRCSLNDTSSSGALIGRDVTSTVTNIQHVTSVLVTRDGLHIATVSSYTSPKVFGDLSNLNVTGSVTGTNSNVKGYLELEWFYPTKETAGDYTCEINAISDEGHNIVFRQNLSVDVAQPGIDDLVNHIRTIEVHMANLDSENQALRSEVGLLKTQASSSSHRMDEMMHALNESRHIERGEAIHCGGEHLNTTITQKFTVPYKTAPVVHLSLRHVDYHFVSFNGHSHRHIYWINLISVSQNDFQFQCKAWGDYAMDWMSVRWISFPHTL